MNHPIGNKGTLIRGDAARKEHFETVSPPIDHHLVDHTTQTYKSIFAHVPRVITFRDKHHDSIIDFLYASFTFQQLLAISQDIIIDNVPILLEKQARSAVSPKSFPMVYMFEGFKNFLFIHRLYKDVIHFLGDTPTLYWSVIHLSSLSNKLSILFFLFLWEART